MNEEMLRNIYMCFALMLLAACNAQGLNSATSADIESDTAANESVIEYEHDKYVCESKGGYYSKTLGCFE